eukprot:1989772-Prymnesium_polylepis.1
MYAKGGSHEADGGSRATVPATVVLCKMRKPAPGSCARASARCATAKLSNSTMSPVPCAPQLARYS